MSEETKILVTDCCIAGGGPAGLMLGYLLARGGVDVTVLEKHADFLRDFRGDTVHPSTLELMHELGLLDEFLKRPHQEFQELFGQVGKEQVTIADFTHLPTVCKFVALMPQWDFLNFIAEQAAKHPSFHLLRETKAISLIEEDNTIKGLKAESKTGPIEIRAKLTVGADGRHSTIRDQAKLPVEDLGAPMDVFWMKISRRETDPVETFGHVDAGRILVMLNRDDYWQCAFVIPKGAAEQIKTKGLESFHKEITNLAPFLSDRVGEIQDWTQVSLLSVTVDRLKEWARPGLLCIGDAAHAMSPIGGVGINLAIQDAVATANLLASTLKRSSPTLAELQQVQHRRTFPTKVTQGIQLFIQDRMIGRVLGSERAITLPWPMKLLQKWSWLRRWPARLVGVGVRPEHVSRDLR